MKKIISLALVCVMMLGMLSVVSFAEDKTIAIEPKFGGMENWVNSPNKGENADMFQLLMGVTCDGAFPAVLDSTDLEWTLKIVGSDGSDKTIKVKPGTVAKDYNLVRFETTLAEGDNQWIPTAGTTYTINASVVAEGVTYTGASAENAWECKEGFVPTVPGVPTPDVAGDLTVGTAYGKVENWSGKTYFITTVASNNNNDLFEGVNGETPKYTLKVTVADETAGKTYTIDQYAFDTPNAEIYGTSFFRFALVEYGIPVANGSSYTIKLEVVKDGAVVASGVSETSLYPCEVDPIVPETIPHEATVEDGIFPVDPVDPPVDPVDPPVDQPETGDSAVWAIVFAAVAMLGMGVVVTKKVNA